MKIRPTTAPCSALIAALLAALHATASAAPRDPTVPPAEAQAAMAARNAGSAPADEAGGAPMPRHIVVSNGRSYVVERGRRFGVGDALGNARIERIDSDAVWLREGSSTRRVPLYAGVTKRSAIENTLTSPSPAASAVAGRLARSSFPQKEVP